MIICCVSLLLISTELPPLTAAQQVSLATAIDDRDHQESAFAALAEATLEIDTARIDADVLARLQPFDWDRAVEDPEALRGHPLLVVGRLEQSDPLARPWDAYREWFLRLPNDRVVAVYVPIEDDRPPGTRVRVVGRFYKRIQAEARDGTTRVYPAMVGRPLPAESLPFGGILIAILVIALLVCWLLLRITIRQRGIPTISNGNSFSRLQEDEDADGGEVADDLPTDPAGALDELARRRDESTRGGDP